MKNIIYIATKNLTCYKHYLRFVEFYYDNHHVTGESCNISYLEDIYIYTYIYSKFLYIANLFSIQLKIVHIENDISSH